MAKRPDRSFDVTDMKKQISAIQTEANIREIMQWLADTPTRLRKLSKGLSDNKLHEPLGKGERFFTEGLAHLLNCESRSFEAICLALLAKDPVITRFHPERDIGRLLQLELMSINDMLAYFKFRRAVLLRALSPLKEKQWSRTIREEGKRRQESVYWQAESLYTNWNTC